MNSDMIYGPAKPLSKLSKNALIHLATDRLQQIINLRQDIDQAENIAMKNLNELRTHLEGMTKNRDYLEKDLSIMQQALNDIEEKNRTLTVQLVDLRKAMKTMSQFL